MGKCSGFPNCCILFYCTAWKVMHGSTNVALSDKERWRQVMIRWYHRVAGRANYVPCPLCLISGARVRVNRCTSRCGHRAESRRLIQEEFPDIEFIRDYLDS